MRNVATKNGPVSVYVNVDDVAVTFGPREGSPLPYQVNGVAYEGTVYMRRNVQGMWHLSDEFVRRVEDWTRGTTDAAWKVMFATAETLADEFYTPENVKQAKRESLESKIESVEREIARLENDLAQLKNDLRSL